MTATELNANTSETSKVGKWLREAIAAFFHRLKANDARGYSTGQPVKSHLLAAQTWLVTWQRHSGETQTSTVMISGVWHMGDIEAQARDALHLQCDIPNARITRLTMDCRK